MRSRPFAILTMLAGGALGACTAENGVTSWVQPAGAFIDEGGFGNATVNNITAQMCAGRAKGYAVPEPIVVLDPTDAKSLPAQPAMYHGQVRCSGRMDGKYAQVIYAEYVESATYESQLSSEPVGSIVGATGE